MDVDRQRAPRADAQQALAAIRGELARLRSCASRIERSLGELEAAPEAAAAVTRARPERYLRVLVDVYERGGRHGVDAQTWAAIGARHGYNRRGLGGFFTGGRAPLRRLEGRVVLTPYGEELVDRFLAQIAS